MLCSVCRTRARDDKRSALKVVAEKLLDRHWVENVLENFVEAALVSGGELGQAIVAAGCE